jgi:aryl sulfotransferase
MQTIIVSLMWPAGDAPAPVMELSPWLEAKFNDLDEVLARLAAQQHRRVIKSHTPADGIPMFDDARYVYVGRDGRDAFMSFVNHHEKFKGDVRRTMNRHALADGVPPMPDWDGDLHRFFTTWLEDALLLHHLTTFWSRRAMPNLLFIHYSDLQRDLESEMRRVAAFLEINIPPVMWPAVVERCTFEAMKARPAEIGAFRNFEGGAESFLFKGTNGRWRDVLRPDEVAAYERRAGQLLTPEALAWLEFGCSGIAADP